MGEGTRVVEYADKEDLKSLMIEMAALDKRLSTLEQTQLQGVHFGNVVTSGKVYPLVWDEESKSYKSTFKF